MRSMTYRPMIGISKAKPSLSDTGETTYRYRDVALAGLVPNVDDFRHATVLPARALKVNAVPGLLLWIGLGRDVGEEGYDG